MYAVTLRRILQGRVAVHSTHLPVKPHTVYICRISQGGASLCVPARVNAKALLVSKAGLDLSRQGELLASGVAGIHVSAGT